MGFPAINRHRQLFLIDMNPYSDIEAHLLTHCTVCPRGCGANRFTGKLGYCRSDAGFNVSSVCVHKGEEPVISGKKGICNVFFPHCNLQCVYCQNYDISCNQIESAWQTYTLPGLVDRICQVLEHTENMVGFVSPSHYVPQMMAIIREIRQRGLTPVFVYNTNGYDKAETLQMLEEYIDVYLTDFKYLYSSLAQQCSKAANYPEVASEAFREMFRQKGSTLRLGDDGLALSGIIVRHLVLPGNVDNSIEVLKYLAEEFSSRLHISLMAQYYPTQHVSGHPKLGRTIAAEEYEQVVDAFHSFGFFRGWVQELSSQASYRPDFLAPKPFDD
jgi:putative pyruvate formate lyase activating enzyme